MPPHDATIHAQIAPETRRRDLFCATLYTGAVQVEGSLTVPAIELKHMPGATLR
ncbi:MAG: hypothetical protein ACRYHQ_20330 [Janthinobacterium lividum]